MREEVDRVDATPSKRIFLSIIADYDLYKGISELIDNAIDMWSKNSNQNKLDIEISLDKNQQAIKVVDNAGGIKKSDLRAIVSPGTTLNLPSEQTIGIFGVGTKRAAVALAQNVRIISRYKGDDSVYGVEFDDSWLQNEEWLLPVYKYDLDLDKGSTIVELTRLRQSITEDKITRLKDHLSAVYALFLNKGDINIEINGEKIQAKTFDDWAYPPNYPPHKYYGKIPTDEGVVEYEIIGGLTKKASPATGEYGVYIYCNNRLIARALKSYDVGFYKGIAGVPHPSISLLRVLVFLKGKSKLMPWNSSKSDINPAHPIFLQLRKLLLEIVKNYASLSRRLEGKWPQEVFKYTSGKIEEIKVENLEKPKTYLPPLPKSKPRYSDKVKELNEEIRKNKPWTVGLYESLIAVDIILHQKLEQKNRICLILLDSTLEISFKEYLVNETEEHYPDKKLRELFEKRHELEKEIKKQIKKKNIEIDEKVWKKIKYYHDLRNKLIHERATVNIPDNEINDFKRIVEEILNKMFGINFPKGRV